jgi:hypothetical protein
VNCPVVPVRLVRGTCAVDHKETTIHLTRVPCVGELVPWPETMEPCYVQTVAHHDLRRSETAATCEVR